MERFLEACKTGTLKQVQDALTDDIDINGCDTEHYSPGISFVCERSDWNEAELIVEFLLSKNALPNVCGIGGKNAFHYACRHSSSIVVKQILDRNPLLLRSVCGDWMRPYGMFQCCTRQDEEAAKILRLLLSRSDPINQKNSSGSTPLSFACSYGTFAVVTELLFYDNKALIEKADTHEGLTPLLAACINKEFGSDIIQLLVDSGANVHAKTKTGTNMMSLLIHTGPVLFSKVKHLLPADMKPGAVFNCPSDPIGSTSLYQSHGSKIDDGFFSETVKNKRCCEIAWADLRLGLPLNLQNKSDDVFKALEESTDKRLWKWASREFPRQHPVTGDTVLHLLCRSKSLGQDDKLNVLSDFKRHYFNPLTPNFKNQLAVDLTDNAPLIQSLRDYMRWRPDRFVTEWFGPVFMSRATRVMIILRRYNVCKDVSNMIIERLSRMENIYVPSKQ